MNKPYIFFKDPSTTVGVLADITTLLQPNEVISNITPTTINPTSPHPLIIAITSPLTSPQVTLSLSGGDNNISYGFQLTVTTNIRVFLIQIAVTVANEDTFAPYTVENPDAFQDLVDEIEAGKAAIGTAVFSFRPEIDPAGGFVTWELLASDGTVYAGGNAFSYSITSNGIANIVKSQAIITVPSTVPPSLDDQKYQLRYTLQLPQPIGVPGDPLNDGGNQRTIYQFENIRIVGLNTVPLGTQPSVELQGVPATVSIVLDKLYDNVTVELWSGNTQIAPPASISEYQKTANGWYFAGVIDTSVLTVSLVPYQVIWKYWASTNTAMIYQDNADFWVVNPSIMSAVNDVRAKVNKARTTLYGTPDLLYPNPTVLTWLRRGGDAFNGAYGVFTSFTFTNALGAIREFWLLCAEKAAIEAQYLAEGEKAFNFQGAAISLDVDRTSYLDTAASRIQSQLDNELKLIKQNLVIRGNTGGDGSADPTKLTPGATGSVGLLITPASGWSRFGYGYIRNVIS
jgi:hypothetical protein